MARLPRVVVPNVPHHITQRGNARQIILASDADRTTYLELLRHYSHLYGLSLLGYCLMSNHVHLIAIPHSTDALAHTLKQTHGRYASYWNACQSLTGHVWQGRFYSCPLDESHLWVALRYVELNPVRARMVTTAESWRWSSAAAHCGAAVSGVALAMDLWRNRWTETAWRCFLGQTDSPADLQSLRRSTHTGRPLGTDEFITSLEQQVARPLVPRKGGRPRKPAVEKPLQPSFTVFANL